MTETALSEDALRDSLLDLRLPEMIEVAPLADVLFAAGFGGCVGLLVIAGARLLSRRRRPSVQISLADRVDALQALPPDERRVGFLHLLKEIAPDRYAELGHQLYRPDSTADPEQEVLGRV